MRARVMSAARELGYEPDLIARSLRTGTSHTFGFLVADLANPISSEIIRGAEDRARVDGYGLLLTNSEGDPALDRANLHLFLQRRVDGIILFTAHEGERAIESQLRNLAVPIVVLDRTVPTGSDASTVFFDHAPGIAAAVAHLLERGHQRIAFISGPADLRPVRDRLSGFEEAFRVAKIVIDPGVIRLGSLLPKFGYEQTVALLGASDAPTAILVGGNRLLTGVLEALHERGRIVGSDIAIVSCDDVDLTRFYRPPISVVARDTYQMGRVAAEMLLDRATDREGTVGSVLLPTWFIPRESSAFPVRVGG
jgi:LacI family transcriptional regulator